VYYGLCGDCAQTAQPSHECRGFKIQPCGVQPPKAK
jgi:hypothetical protein